MLMLIIELINSEILSSLVEKVGGGGTGFNNQETGVCVSLILPQT